MSLPSARPRSPILIYRIVHIDNLAVLARRGGLHAPSRWPADGLPYRSIHDESIRQRRGARPVPCGPRGSVDDYVSFYLGPRSPMLYRIWRTADVAQSRIVYLVSSVARLGELELPFVFSDGHGLQEITRWFDDPASLASLDWEAIQATYWSDTPEDPDRCRRKQAELLVHQFVPWTALLGIATFDRDALHEAEARLAGEARQIPQIKVRRDWYYGAGQDERSRRGP